MNVRRVAVVLGALFVAGACSGSTQTATPTTTTTAPTSTTVAPTSTGAPGTLAPDEVVMTIGGASITLGEFDELVAEHDAATADVARAWLQITAVEVELAANYITITGLDMSEAVLLLEQQTGRPASEITNFEIRNFAVLNALDLFARERGAEGVEPAPIEVLCSSHILVETEAEAIDVAARAREGEDFAALAQELSTGPSGPNGGDLGCSPTSNYVAEFTEGARAAGVGITDPVESQFGWHVIQVRSIGPSTADVHPDADPAQLEAWSQGAVDEAVNAFRESVIDTVLDRVAAADIDPQFGRWDADANLFVPAG